MRRLRECIRGVRVGNSLIILGIMAAVLAGLSHWFTLRRLMCVESPVLTQWPLSITMAILSAVVGLAGHFRTIVGDCI